MAHTYEVGDTVTYEVFGGGLRMGVVTAKHEDIKNGKSGFDLESFWGYDYQIVRVERRA